MLAAAKGNLQAVEFLLSLEGIDLNAKSNGTDTALMKAVESDSPKICQLLLERGADPAITDIRGNTAKSKAALVSPEALAVISKFESE